MSLVSQIHSLKKELESKDNLIHTLEDSLHQSRVENEGLTEDVINRNAEIKGVKSQMKSLERDMLKEFEKTVRERDDAVESVADTRKRLDDSKKKVRAQEEDANRTHELWERERQDLEDKSRKLEGKNHVLEQHLRTMAAAMAAPNTVQSHTTSTDDIPGPRTSSRQSNRSLDDIYEDKPATNFRGSRMNSLRRPGSSQMGSLSLAEELEMDDEDVDAENDDEDDHATTNSNVLPEEEQPSRRYSEDEKAKKVMGFHTDGTEQRLRSRGFSQTSTNLAQDHIRLPQKQSVVAYTDTAIQCSPPPSPMPQSRPVEIASEKTVEQTEHAANQSRKRVSIPQIFVEQNPSAKTETPKPKAIKALRMVSTACQTIEGPINPLSTPNDTSNRALLVPTKETRSWSTQTSDDGLPPFSSAGPRISLSPLDVPVIAIHPPSSRPPSSHNSVVLPPRTKNAGCQVVIELPRNLRSTAMQTDEDQSEKRSRVPSRLLFSSPSTQFPPQVAGGLSKGPEILQMSITEIGEHPVPNVPPKSSKRSTPRPSIEEEDSLRRPSSPKFKDAYPGNNDNGPLNSKDRFGPRRPIRSDSIFAGFDVSDDGNNKIPSDYSDDDFGNTAPIRKTLSKVQNSWKLVPQLEESVFDRASSASEDQGDQLSKEPSKQLNKMPMPKAKSLPHSTSSKSFPMKHTEALRKLPGTAKEADIRRKALVANGISEHMQRARSPSAPNARGKEANAIAPPFPVPTRSSSRKIPVSASDGAVSPSPYTTSFFTTRRGQDPGKVSSKRKMLRKTQSAAAVSKPTEPPQTHPPLPKSASSSMPSRPKSPRLPHNQFVLPYDHVAEFPTQLSKVSRPSSHAGTASIETPSQQTSVVDAIAQTMVGEWMWKYVRKRTSFGITETPQAEFEQGRSGEAGNSSGVRHKRWVWLAPYENAVIWSSKQPTSGPALLGKGGRKRRFLKYFFLPMIANLVNSDNSIRAGCQRRYAFAQKRYV